MSEDGRGEAAARSGFGAEPGGRGADGNPRAQRAHALPRDRLDWLPTKTEDTLREEITASSFHEVWDFGVIY